MRIALIAHLKHAIREPFAGGLQMHTHMLARSLRRRGHEVTLFVLLRSDAMLGVEAGLQALIRIRFRRTRCGPAF